MSYPDLQHEIAQRVEPPGFDEVLGRAAAARRRRRTTIGAGLAAAVVVGGLAVTSDLARPDARSSDPARPGPTQTWDGSPEVDPTLPEEVKDVLRADDSHLWSVSGSSGAYAAVWRSCPTSDRCHFALTVRGNDATGTVLDGPATLHPGPTGWILEHADGWSRVIPDGRVEPLTEADVPEPSLESGDRAVPTPDGWRLLRASTLMPLPTPAFSDVDGAHITSDGRLVVAGSRNGSLMVSVTDDGESWRTAPAGGGQGAATAVVAGSGDHVAVAVLGDADDGSFPLLGVQVSSDAGAGWLMARGFGAGASSAPRNLSSLAVSATGSVFLTTESHGLIRIDGEGLAEAIPRSSHDTSVFTDGNRVCLVAEAGRVDHLECSADDGRTWQARPLPGFR